MIRMPRRRAAVTHIWCRHCHNWVPARRYQPTIHACRTCARHLAGIYRTRLFGPTTTSPATTSPATTSR